ncbi:MAG: diaminopropionate ammonia-lyase [Thermomicrobiales bacterium]
MSRYSGESFFHNANFDSIAVPVAAGNAFAFHRSMSGYAPSPLLESPSAAAAIGAKSVLVKHEAMRFGLPAFKILGASWATANAVLAELARRGLPAPAIGEGYAAIAGAAKQLNPMTLACATDGNHGRAVARMAKLFGFSARIYVPDDMALARIDAIESEGAVGVKLAGTYDDAISRSALDAGEDCLVISDTSWPGYEDIPRWVIEGYGTIFAELAEQVSGDRPDLWAIQMGVGALAAASIPAAIAADAQILGVEPDTAACIQRSLETGALTLVPGPHPSIMAGLNCGLPSEIAWPVLVAGLNDVIAVDDRRAEEAMRLLAADGIVAGETGAAGLAGLLGLVAGFDGDLSGKTVLILTTEGATDPINYARIVG